jgi:hypothetical protein
MSFRTNIIKRNVILGEMSLQKMQVMASFLLKLYFKHFKIEFTYLQL